MAVSRFAEITVLESEVADLAERLETRKAVERAKNVLQRDLGLTEPDAFRWIQKTAMDLRLTHAPGRRRRHHARSGHRRGLTPLAVPRPGGAPHTASRLDCAQPRWQPWSTHELPRCVGRPREPWSYRSRSRTTEAFPAPIQPTRARGSWASLLAALLVPFALVLTMAAPANAETCLLASAEKGCIVGTIRTEVDVVAGRRRHGRRGPTASTRPRRPTTGASGASRHRARRLHRDDRRGDPAQGHRRRPARGHVRSSRSPTSPRAARRSASAPATTATRSSISDRVIRSTFSGIRLGLLLALASIGLSLIYGTTGLSNFAHAEQVTMGGMLGYLVVNQWGVNPWLGVRAGRDLLRVHRLGPGPRSSGSRCDGEDSAWPR